MRLTARYVLLEDTFHTGVVLDVEDGRVREIHRDATLDGVENLGEVALVPGLVNAHSHAFQRAIRGRTEYVLPGRGDDDFWTWRDKMYAAALKFGPEEIEVVSRLAFLEMALTGITSVGEFHYVHHQPDGAPYEDPNELAHRVIAAATDVGIRIALLRVAYHRGGHARDAQPDQRRFVEPDVDTYLRRVEALERTYADEPLVSVGMAPHSIRAVPRGWLEAIRDAGAEGRRPIHIHACEQRREIEESVEEYGKPPVLVFDELGLLDDKLTLVHATHLSDPELVALQAARPTVCACPTTERNLGDGFLPARELVRRDVPIALGSDSHTNIDLWEEMRLVEYHERLRYERRNVLATELGSHDARLDTGKILWPMGSAHGARALGLDAGSIGVGRPADFVALDLEHITLVGATAETLLNDVTLSMTPHAVRDVWVAGRRIVENRSHRLADETARAFRAIVSSL